MEILFKEGYCIYEDNKNDIVIATPHSGPAFETSTARDDNSETVASLCWRKLGGKLVVANVPRKRLWGVDLNRDIPDLNLALNMFNLFKNTDDNDEKLYQYRRRYAWVAKDETDYNHRLAIYKNFWKEVNDAKYVILVHRALTRIKNISSIIDIVIVNDTKNKPKIKDIIRDTNNKYYEFLKKIEPSYKKMVMFEEERFVSNILRVSNQFSLDKINGEFETHLKQDLEKIKLFATPKYYKYLNEDFNSQNFLRAVKNVIDNSPIPQVTMEYAFDGSLAYGPRHSLTNLNEKIVIEVESSRFLNFWYPEVAAEMISDIAEKICKI
ncbi:hypothetical protein J4471_04455 [Candidatus Woesearchaeota archaeon]|nr:hypothetical protein [Candidatus Woesearchaeota archaeon]